MFGTKKPQPKEASKTPSNQATFSPKFQNNNSQDKINLIRDKLTEIASCLSQEDLVQLFVDTFVYMMTTYQEGKRLDPKNKDLNPSFPSSLGDILTMPPLSVDPDLVFPNGYRGGGVLGLPWGVGDIVDSDGNIYSGQWRSGKRHGTGTMAYTDGANYTGTFVGDCREGQGRFIFPEGNVHRGGYSKGKEHGPYILINPDGSLKFGVYEEGVEHGPFVTISAQDTEVCIGNYMQGKLNGFMRTFELFRIEEYSNGKLISDEYHNIPFIYSS